MLRWTVATSDVSMGWIPSDRCYFGCEYARTYEYARMLGRYRGLRRAHGGWKARFARKWARGP